MTDAIAADVLVDDSPTPSRWDLLRSTLRDQRRNLIIGSLIGLMWMVGKISVPILVRFSIDTGIEEGEYLWLWVMLIAIAGLAVGSFTALRRYFAFREARWTETRLRERLFNHILSLHIGYHDRAQTGQLMSRSSSDLQQIQSFVVMIPITMSNLGMIITASVILFVTDPLLALVALAPLPLVNIAGRRFSQSIHSAVLQVQAEQAELATVVEETIGGVRVVKGFGAEEVQSKRLRKEADDIRGVSIQAARIRAKYLPAIDLLPQLVQVVEGLGVGLRVTVEQDICSQVGQQGVLGPAAKQVTPSQGVIGAGKQGDIAGIASREDRLDNLDPLIVSLHGGQAGGLAQNREELLFRGAGDVITDAEHLLVFCECLVI